MLLCINTNCEYLDRNNSKCNRIGQLKKYDGKKGICWKHEATLATNVDFEKTLPYLETIDIVVKRKYNPNYGDNRICKCGHPYYRHFDSYEDMQPVGCKYCNCEEFIEQE